MINVEQVLKDFVEELYFRAPCSKNAAERKAIKGVQHALERVLKKHGVNVSFRDGLDDETKEKLDKIKISL